MLEALGMTPEEERVYRVVVGGYRTAETFVRGLTTAVDIGGALIAVGAVAAALIKPRRSAQVAEVALELAA